MPYKDPNDPRKIASARKAALSYFNRNKAKQRAVNRLWRADLRRKLIEHYSNGTFQCECCGENEYVFLTIDHINNNGTEERKKYANGGHQNYRWIIKQGYPDGLRVLCYNCNCGRAKTKDRTCPHTYKTQEQD